MLSLPVRDPADARTPPLMLEVKLPVFFLFPVKLLFNDLNQEGFSVFKDSSDLVMLLYKVAKLELLKSRSMSSKV